MAAQSAGMSPADSSAAPHGRILQSSFRPHPLFRGPHAQTMLPALLRPLPRLAIRRERLELSDGDFVTLGWAGEHKLGAPLVLLVHGLTGSFDSKYLRGAARRLIRRGWRCVIFQQRGAGGEPNRLARSYHHGASDDLREVVVELRRREPKTTLAAAGWSLGANVLLKYLGEDGAAAPLTAAVAASPPFQLRPCAERLRTGTSRVYQRRLLRDLKAALRLKYSQLTPPEGLEAAFAARDFFAFDDAVTAPANGYRDAEDYYARAACGPFLRGIQVPTLVLHAMDDPFMAPSIVPDESALAPAVTLELSKRGGHVGFVAAGRFGQPVPWLERRIPEFLGEYFTP
ncbi:MAG TPA: hydrolase [Solimonas sp.]|nr:hydrolase [Solimonas sp.]